METSGSLNEDTDFVHITSMVTSGSLNEDTDFVHITNLQVIEIEIDALTEINILYDRVVTKGDIIDKKILNEIQEECIERTKADKFEKRIQVLVALFVIIVVVLIENYVYSLLCLCIKTIQIMSYVALFMFALVSISIKYTGLGEFIALLQTVKDLKNAGPIKRVLIVTVSTTKMVTNFVYDLLTADNKQPIDPKK
jgi:hypothetical protein